MGIIRHLLFLRFATFPHIIRIDDVRDCQTIRMEVRWEKTSAATRSRMFTAESSVMNLTQIVSPQMGMWIDVTQNSNLTVAGVVPAHTTIHLLEGWNLIEFPSLNSSYIAADLKAEVGADKSGGIRSCRISTQSESSRRRWCASAGIWILGEGRGGYCLDGGRSVSPKSQKCRSH